MPHQVVFYEGAAPQGEVGYCIHKLFVLFVFLILLYYKFTERGSIVPRSMTESTPKKYYKDFHYRCVDGNLSGMWVKFAPFVTLDELRPEQCAPSFTSKLIPTFGPGAVPATWLYGMKVVVQDRIRCRQIASPNDVVMLYVAHMHPDYVPWYEPRLSAWFATRDPIQAFIKRLRVLFHALRDRPRRVPVVQHSDETIFGSLQHVRCRIAQVVVGPAECSPLCWR
jgi:hypothetical protein